MIVRRVALSFILVLIGISISPAQVPPVPPPVCLNPDGTRVPCTDTRPGTRVPAPTPAKPQINGNAAAAEQARISPEEQKRRAQAAASRRQEEQAAAEQQQEFDNAINRAVRDLKGVGATPAPAASTTLQTRPVDSIEAASTINANAQSAPRDLSTEWKRLQCAHEIAAIAIRKTIALVGNNPSAPADSLEFDEIRYLADEVVNAAEGKTLGVTCHAPKARPPAITPPEPRQVQAAYQTLSKQIVRDVDDIKTMKTPPVSVPVPVEPAAQPNPATGVRPDPPVSSDQARIDAIARQQRQMQSDQDQALALLRRAQQLLNDLNQVRADNDKLGNGSLPNTITEGKP